MKGIGRISAMRPRICQQWNQLIEAERAVGPPVGENDWQWRRAITLLVDNMNCCTIYTASKLVEAIEFLLLSLPVELVSPIGDQLLEIGQVYAVLPTAIVILRQTGTCQALS